MCPTDHKGMKNTVIVIKVVKSEGVVFLVVLIEGGCPN